ncbi:DUF59 domain-containing protein [bacterium]|nr:DUF59 domain-containing protein [bacterium]
MIKRIYEILQSVLDPDTGIDVFSMGLVDVMEYEEKTGTVKLKFTPTNPMCPMAFFMADEMRRKLKDEENIDKVVFTVENYYRAKELIEAVSDQDESSPSPPAQEESAE